MAAAARTGIRKSVLFSVLACLFAWVPAFSFFHFGGRIDSMWFLPFATGIMITPTAAAAVVHKVLYHQKLRSLSLWFRFNRWFIIAWLAPLFLVLMASVASTALPGVSFSLELEPLHEGLRSLPPEQADEALQALQEFGPLLPLVLIVALIIGALVAGPTINAAVALGEEIGWRGFLQKELLPLGFWTSSFIIGAVWGVWHLPLILHGFNYPQHPVAGVFMMIAFTMLMSPLFSYLRLKANSVLAPSIAHGGLNALGGSLMFLSGGDDLSRGLTGVAGLAVLLAVNLVLLGHMRRHGTPGEVDLGPPRPADSEMPTDAAATD